MDTLTQPALGDSLSPAERARAYLDEVSRTPTSLLRPSQMIGEIEQLRHLFGQVLASQDGQAAFPAPAGTGFGTEGEARQAALRMGGPPREDRPILTPEQCLEMLALACRAAGAAPGAYDEAVLSWLAEQPPATCASIAGLILRAHQAGKAGAS